MVATFEFGKITSWSTESSSVDRKFPDQNWLEKHSGCFSATLLTGSIDAWAFTTPLPFERPKVDFTKKNVLQKKKSPLETKLLPTYELCLMGSEGFQRCPNLKSKNSSIN